MKTIEAYKCEICGKIFLSEEEALNCENTHYADMENSVIVFFENGAQVSFADIVRGRHPDNIRSIVAIKVVDEKIAKILQNYFWDKWNIIFPYLGNDNVSRWPITMVCDEERWVWTELNTAIEEEEKRHTARMEKLESYR